MPADSRPEINPYRDFERRLRILENAHVRPETIASAYDMAPHGIMGRIKRTTSSGAISVSTTTAVSFPDMPITAGRSYGFILNGQVLLNNVVQRWDVDLLADGNFVDTIAVASSNAATNLRREVNGFVVVDAVTTATRTFAIRFEADAVGALGTITLQAGSTITDPPFQFTMIDMGKTPAVIGTGV